MIDTKRTMLTLSTEAVEALGKLTTPRKYGEYVSKLLLDALAGKNQAAAQPGILERMDSRLERIEKRLNSF